MEFQILGIDIAKNKFDCSFIAAPNSPNGRKAKSKVLPNHPAGFAGLLAWLDKNKGSDIKNIKVFMEATGVYHEALAEFLYAQGCAVYIFNPADAAAYIRSDNLYKTDKSDARALADMGIDRLTKGSAGKSLWQPAPPEVKHLKALLARLDALEADLQREDNRMEKACAVSSPALVVQSITTMQTQLRKQIDDLRLYKRQNGFCALSCRWIFSGCLWVFRRHQGSLKRRVEWAFMPDVFCCVSYFCRA